MKMKKPLCHVSNNKIIINYIFSLTFSPGFLLVSPDTFFCVELIGDRFGFHRTCLAFDNRVSLTLLKDEETELARSVALMLLVWT